jgi:hypothetical protein
VFDRIKGVSSEKIVSQVQAIYLFDVEGRLHMGLSPHCTLSAIFVTCIEEGKYFIDFKNGTGTVGKGKHSVERRKVIKIRKR